MSASDADSAFVLGLDGVPWPLIERWTTEGNLPNFERLFDEGASCMLRSTIPANTPVAWPSIATGMRPDIHGIYDFMRLDETYGQRPYNSTDLKAPPLWELVTPAAVANVPMTYPAQEVDGELIAGMMTPGSTADKGFTHPPSLQDELLERIPEYAIGLDWQEYYDREAAFLRDLRKLIDARRELLDMLIERDEHRLIFFVFTAPDRLQHLIWEEETLLEQYRYFDAIVGDVLSYCERENRNLFVVSDHGFGEIRRHVAVNRLLVEAGFLAKQESGTLRNVLSRVGITKDGVLDALNRVGITDEQLVNELPQSIIDTVATRVPGDHALYDMDPERTTAFLHGRGNIYINDTERFGGGIVRPAEVPRVRADVIQTLRGLTDPETGERVLDVYDSEEIYPRDTFAPDVIVEGRDPYLVVPELSQSVFRDPGAKVADHRPEGIFFAWGRDIAAGRRLDEASVVDVAPTVLHTIGQPIPDRVDGTVLDLFALDSPTASRPIEEREYRMTARDADVDGDHDEVKNRLRGLGYIE